MIPLHIAKLFMTQQTQHDEAIAKLISQQAEVAEKAAAAARADYIKAMRDQNAASLREVPKMFKMFQTAGQYRPTITDGGGGSGEGAGGSGEGAGASG